MTFIDVHIKNILFYTKNREEFAVSPALSIGVDFAIIAP